MKTFFQIVSFAACVFFFSWLFVYKTGLNTHAIQSEDTLPAMFIPVTLLKEGTLHSDTYFEMIRARYPHPDDKNHTRNLTPFYFRRIVDPSLLDLQDKITEKYSGPNTKITFKDTNFGKHYISMFPLMSGLVSVPVYFVPVLLGIDITWENIIVLSHISSALIVATAGGFLYLLLTGHFKLKIKESLLLTAVYLFGTINYALVSQALWQHGTNQLFLILGLIFFFRYVDAPKSKGIIKNPKVANIFLSGVFFGVAVLSRPTSAVTWLIMSILVLYSYKNVKEIVRYMGAFCLGLVPAVTFFTLYNKFYFFSIRNQGYAHEVGNSWESRFPEGFLGLWISPSKGMLVYSPVLIFSLIGLYLVIKRKDYKKDLKYIVFALAIIAHTLLLGKWKHWYGGWSFGYRMAADILPFMILLMVPYIKSDLFKKTKRIFYLLFGFSVLVQFYGMVFFDGVWHAAYDDGYFDTRWLWSIRDSELAFNIRRILVKLGMLERACPTCLPKS